MKVVVAVLLVALCLLHHDFWWWGDTRPLVLGFLPIGLAWHVGLSFATAIVWWLATMYCWPHGLDDEEDGPNEEGGGGQSA